MAWHKVTLTSKGIPTAKLSKLQNRFHQLWIASGSPKGMALFYDRVPQPRPDRQIGIQLSLYFSPDCFNYAASLISEYPDSTLCKQPLADEVAFLAGDQGCWDLLE